MWCLTFVLSPSLYIGLLEVVGSCADKNCRSTYCSGPLKSEEIELSPWAVGVEITNDFTGPDR
jgi:hypothetical protein